MQINLLNKNEINLHFHLFLLFCCNITSSYYTLFYMFLRIWKLHWLYSSAKLINVSLIVCIISAILCMSQLLLHQPICIKYLHYIFHQPPFSLKNSQLLRIKFHSTRFCASKAVKSKFVENVFVYVLFQH